MQPQMPPHTIHSKAIKHLNPASPFLSVVIPAYNESAFLSRALDSLLVQDYKDFEIIVVDNNSSDATAGIARAYGAKVVFEPRQGVGHARQAGFLAAAGQVIATTDADTAVPPRWVSTIAEKFKSSPDLAAYGGLFRLHSGPRLTRLMLPKILDGLWLADYLYYKSWGLPGANMAVRKSCFLQVGGFNTQLRLGEDADLSHRLKAAGRVVLDKQFLVSTSGRRFRNGLLAACYAYVPGLASQAFFKKPLANKLPAVRKETLSAIAFVPLVLSLYIAVFMVLPYFIPSLRVKEAHAKSAVVWDGHRASYAARHRVGRLVAEADAEYHETDGK